MTARRSRVALALLLLLGLSGLTPLAYASPPDPSWVRGIYDDADYDEWKLNFGATGGPGAGSLGSVPEPSAAVLLLLATAAAMVARRRGRERN